MVIGSLSFNIHLRNLLHFTLGRSVTLRGKEDAKEWLTISSASSSSLSILRKTAFRSSVTTQRRISIGSLDDREETQRTSFQF